MKFYRDEYYIITAITIVIISILFIVPFCISTSDGWIAFLIYFLFCIFNIALFLHSDKMCVDSEGISCFISKKRIFFCAWENIKCFKIKYHLRKRCIDIVPIDVSKVEIHNYQFTVSDPYFYFQLTRKSRKIIQQFCPREELIAQLYPKRAKSKRQEKS